MHAQFAQFNLLGRRIFSKDNKNYNEADLPDLLRYSFAFSLQVNPFFALQEHRL